ncbi:hypothetical protein ONZ45_g11746 [Pleurotus djamor]|nr:hypothetical protein ONZ45_g11746 [Pleurotus djamor]
MAERDLWEAFDAGEVGGFSAGNDLTSDDSRRIKDAMDNFGLWDASQTGQQFIDDGNLAGELGEEDDILRDFIDYAGNRGVDGDEDVGKASAQGSHWFPYSSKTSFLLDLLDNFPRLRISGSLMKVFLWILRESGVPSFDALRKQQALLRKTCGIPTLQNRSPKGNVYYMNDPRSIIAKSKVIAMVGPPIFIQAELLVENYLDLSDNMVPPAWSADQRTREYAGQMPNPKREIAQGDPLNTSFLDYFADDVSGNRSKSWNKHWNAYITHTNLPRKLLQQEFHVHFISTSPHATITEQFIAFRNAIESTHHTPVRVHDAITGLMSCFQLYLNSSRNDNPMQSEVCSHIGSKGNYPCRKCEVGGTEKEKESDVGYEALFHPGKPRTARGTLEEVQGQVRLACHGVAKPVQVRQTETGVKDSYTQYWIEYLLEEHRTKRSDPKQHLTSQEIGTQLRTWVSQNQEDIYSGFLQSRGFDPMKDTPVELLHTILLGIVKYIWHSDKYRWAVNASNTIGTSIFQLHDLLDEPYFATWKAVAELSALLWFPEIRNMDEYCEDVEVAVANVLDMFAIINPSKMHNKIKLHLLSHLTEDIRRFGPLIGSATEVFESYNAVFRFCSILSNHLAPSRDIAIQLADQESMKHRLLGGWWPMPDGNWVQAGNGIQDYLLEHPILQRLLGWSSEKSEEPGEPDILFPKDEAVERERLNIIDPLPGSIKLAPRPKKKREYPTFSLQTTVARLAVNSSDYNLHEDCWRSCSSTTTTSGDKCAVGSWVISNSALNENTTIFGRITQILQRTTDLGAIAILDVFQLSPSRHEVFGMPTLLRRFNETVYEIVTTPMLQFAVNVQHDCLLARCEASGKRTRMQERQDSGVTDVVIEHKPLESYVVNTASFHNGSLLRAILPPSLARPIPIFTDRGAKHLECATELREKNAAKQAVQKAKKDAKRAQAADNEEETTETQQNKRARLSRG